MVYNPYSPKTWTSEQCFDTDLNRIEAGIAIINRLTPAAQATPDMTLQVSSGIIFFTETPVEFAGGNSPVAVAPSANPRIDVLVLNNSPALEWVTGTEAVSPTPPSYPLSKIPICEIYNRVGETSIKNADDGANGYIYKDVRNFVNLGGGGDACLVVAANDTPAVLKTRADYICDGIADQAQINTAFGVANTVILTPGTFIIDNSISMGSHQSLIGSGFGSIVKIKDSFDTSMGVIKNSDITGGNIDLFIANLTIDGNRAQQYAGSMFGVYFTKVTYSKVQNCLIKSLKTDSVCFASGCCYNIISGCIHDDNGFGPSLLGQSNYNTIIDNIVKKSLHTGIYVKESCENFIAENQIIESSQFSNHGSYHISIDGGSDANENADNNVIFNNKMRKGTLTNKVDYAIRIFNSYCNRTLISNNDGYLSADSNLIDDGGTNTSFGVGNRENNGTDSLQANYDISVMFDNGASAIAVGTQQWIEVPFKCIIQNAILLADVTGSIQIDVWKDTYTNYPPTDADSITGAAGGIIISNDVKRKDTVGDWATTINAGDILLFNVDSCTTIKKCLVSLTVKRTR